MSDLDIRESNDMSHVHETPVQVYTQSPRATRKFLDEEQETQFGAQVEELTPRSIRVSHEKNEVANNDNQAESISSHPLTTGTLAPIELHKEITEKDPLVSKQSRPFLMFKIVQCLFAAVVLPLNACTWPVMLLRGNIHLAMQPALACVTFLIYCPVVFFGYLAGLPTPAAVMLLLDMLGGVYFTVAAITSGVYWADVEWLLDQESSLEPPLMELENIKKALQAIGLEPDVHLTADKLLMQCLLCSSAATMFLGDVLLTMKYLVYRKTPYTHKNLF